MLIDALEPRRLLAATLDGNGLLTVDGTAQNDDVSLALSGGQITVSLNGNAESSFAAAFVTSIQVNGLGGNDSISLAGVNVPATLSGGNGDDTLVDGAAADVLAGNDDNDTFFADDGAIDNVLGGQGLDTVSTFNAGDVFTGIEAGIPVPQATVTLGGVNGSIVLNGTVTPIDFGSVSQGQNGPTLTFTVKNTGTDVLTLGGVTVPTGYVLTEALTGPLAPGESDSFTLQVDTTAAGTKAGTVSFDNSDPNQNPFSFAVTATVTPVAPQNPEVTVSVGGNAITDGQGTAIGFGNVLQGGNGPERVFTVTNDGTSVLNLTGLTLPDGYTLVEGLSASLNPGASDTFTVRLDSAVVGAKGGSISFATNDPDEDPFNFPVTGVVETNASAIGVAVVTPPGPVDNGNTVIEFGNRPVGGKFASRQFKVTNTGNSDLVLGTLSVPAGFKVLEGLTGTLAPGESDVFTIRFEPRGTPGERGGFVTFTTNAPGAGEFKVGVHGTVLAVGTGPVPEVTVSALRSGQLRGVVSGSSSFTFGTQVKGTALNKAARTFRVTNDGNADLKLSKLSVGGGFVILDGLKGTLKPGETDTLIVAIDTRGATGEKSATVKFTTNDADEKTFTFTVTGTVAAVGSGGTPEVGVRLGNGTAVADGTTTAISFGTVPQGAAAVSRTFTVRNEGTGNLTVGPVNVPAGFTVTAQLSGPIAPGGSKTFTVRMDTASAGNKTGQLSFTTNDANEQTFNFPIAGTVTAVVGNGPNVTASVSGGVLTVTGTGGIDTITLAPSGKAVAVTGNGKAVGGSPFNGVTKIVVNGADGADRIDGSAVGLPLTLSGGNGNDTLIGGSAADSLSGGAGDDDLDGRAGNDTLRGGADDDVLNGGAGLDSFFGEDGNDTLNAADGLADSVLDGGGGDDVFHKDRTDGAVN